MGGVAQEARLEAVVGGRGHHHLSDRRRVVEDEAELGAQGARRRTALAPSQGELLAGGEEQLDAHRRPVGHQPPRRAQDGGHRGLVVGAEDGLVAVPERRPSSRTTSTGAASGTVSRWAQSRIVRAPSGPAMRASRLPASEPVVGAAAVLLDLEPERAQLGGHRVGHRPLAAGRALDLAEPDEVGHQPFALGRSGAADGCAHRRKATRERSRRATRPAPPAPPREPAGRRARARRPRSRGRAAAGAAAGT